jgi:tetratricopeptide (TPR) repeat protein
LLLLTTFVSVPALSQATTWPDSPDIKALKKQLATAEARKGKDHPDVAEVLLALGNAYRDQGGYVPATPYVERALAITEKAHGLEHVEVAAVLDKLGTLYLRQGDTARARAAYMRASPILQREVGPDHPGYGLFLMHLGELQLLAGQTTEAQQAVDQASTAFGDQLSQAAHEWTGANQAMGLLFLGLGKYRQAEQQLVYALAVRSEALESEKHDEALFYIAPAQNALGTLYVAVGLDDQAEPLLRDALTAYEKRYGKDHPLLEDIIVNLVTLYNDKGDATKAREYLERAQALHQKSAAYSHLPDWPLRTLARATPRSRPPDGPYADARVGDEATYENGDGVPLLRRRVTQVTPVIALIQSDDWDPRKQQWVEGQAEMQPLSATATEDYEGMPGDWGTDTATVAGARIPCRTFLTQEGDHKAKFWIAPAVIPAGGIVSVMVDDALTLRLQTFKRGGN